MIVFSVIGVGFKSLWEITGIGRASAVEPVFPNADARLLVGLVVVAAVLTIITAIRLPKLMARELTPPINHEPRCPLEPRYQRYGRLGGETAPSPNHPRAR